ncbi:hypothetical protein FQZ97_591140 [compost metagenome]
MMNPRLRLYQDWARHSLVGLATCTCTRPLMSVSANTRQSVPSATTSAYPSANSPLRGCAGDSGERSSSRRSASDQTWNLTLSPSTWPDMGGAKRSVGATLRSRLTGIDASIWFAASYSHWSRTPVWDRSVSYCW